MKKTDWRVATLFVQDRHYSAVMPKLTKHWLGTYVDDKLVGVLTLGWGTNPMGTIRKMFPELSTCDYYEIGKMCMDEEMPRNSESQMISKTLDWMKKNTPNIKYLYTWADGIVGKPGYVYQSANFLYGGFVWTDVYITKDGEKVHPRTMQGQLPNSEGLKYGHRPNYDQLKEMEIEAQKELANKSKDISGPPKINKPKKSFESKGNDVLGGIDLSRFEPR